MNAGGFAPLVAVSSCHLLACARPPQRAETARRGPRPRGRRRLEPDRNLTLFVRDPTVQERLATPPCSDRTTLSQAPWRRSYAPARTTRRCAQQLEDCHEGIRARG